MGHGSGVNGWIASFTARVLERLVLQKFCLPFELSHTKYCPLFLFWCPDKSDSVVYSMGMAVTFLHCCHVEVTESDSKMC